jgi:hypothetical protein
LGGWLGIDETQIGLAESFPTLAGAAPHLLSESMAAPQSKPILLYRAWNDVLGKQPDYPAQQIGDCVSFGHGHANDLRQCVEIALGEATEYRETDTEFIYGTSREAGGMLGRGDGSYGSAAVKAMTTMGVASREMLGSAGAYSGSRARSWGRTGVPAELKSKAAPFKLGSAVKVTTWDELVASLRNGSPVTICSNQGFTLRRDNDGFCSASGSWAHCMFISGVRFDRPGACICQSWGADTPSGPTALGQPSFSFWADRRVIERILAAGDSWALSGSPDFAKKRVLPGGWLRHLWPF